MKVHLRIDLVSKFPYAHTVTTSFSDPIVSVAVKPLKAFDMLGVNSLQHW